MAIRIGDNFEYNGRKFLDARQSFDTLEAMNNCTIAPDGFITYCKEDGQRYEFKTDTWYKYTVSSGGLSELEVEELIAEINTKLLAEIENKYATIEYVDEALDGVIIDDSVLSGCSYFGEDEPAEEKIWFSSGVKSAASNITIENPLIAEMFACIRTLQEQVKELQEEVEYLKIHGGGGGGSTPDTPDDPIDPPVEITESYLELEEGGLFLFEDGTCILLEDSEVKPMTEAVLELEDGGLFLMEDGFYFLLEMQPIIEEEDKDDVSAILLENGDYMLYEDGSKILIEQ